MVAASLCVIMIYECQIIIFSRTSFEPHKLVDWTFFGWANLEPWNSPINIFLFAKIIIFFSFSFALYFRRRTFRLYFNDLLYLLITVLNDNWPTFMHVLFTIYNKLALWTFKKKYCFIRFFFEVHAILLYILSCIVQSRFTKNGSKWINSYYIKLISILTFFLCFASFTGMVSKSTC